jgi:polar amino acid transport system substrate-binding protein
MNIKLISLLARRLIITLCCLFTILVVSANGSPTGAPPLRVGVSPVFPPMVFKQGREIVGVEVDLARALGQRLGRAVMFVELRWEDQIDALREGRTDIIMSSLSITPARAYVLDFSLPYLNTGQAILVRREDEAKYLLGIPNPLPGPVGVLRATTGDFLVQRDLPKARRKVYRTEAEAAEALKKKKIDLLVTDSSLVWYLAGVYAVEGLGALPFLLSQEQLAWGMRKGDDPLRNAVNEFIQQAAHDGTLARILNRWTAVGPK